MIRLHESGRVLEYTIVLASATVASSLFLIPSAPPGYDTRSHLAKVAFLLYSLSHGNFTGWSMFWYAGAPLFDVYPPLFYYLTAAISSLLGDVMWRTKLSLLASFILASLGMYLLARRLTGSKLASVIGAVVYAFSPPTCCTSSTTEA